VGGASQEAEADVVAEEEEPPPTNEFENAAGTPDVFQDSVERSYRDDDPSMAEPPSVADLTESKEYYSTVYHQHSRQEPPVRQGVDELHSTGSPVDNDFPRRASYRSAPGSEAYEREALPHEQRQQPSSPDLSQPERRPEFRQQQQDPHPGWGIRQQQPQPPDGSDQRHRSAGRDPSQVRQPSTGGPWGVSQSIDGTGQGRQSPPAQLPTQSREVKDQPTAQERGAPPGARGQQWLGEGLPYLEQPHRPWGEQPAPVDPRVTQQQLRQEPPARYQEHHGQLTVQQQGVGQAGRAPLRQGGPGPTSVAQPPPISNEIQRGPPFVQPPPHAQRNAPPQEHLQPPGQGYRPQQAQTAIDPTPSGQHVPGTHGRIPPQGSGASSYGQYGPYGTAPPGSYGGGPRQGIPPYGQLQSQGQFQQRPQLKQPPLPPPPNQLVETSTTAVKEALGRTWQGLLGLGNRTKEVVGTARTTVVSSAIEASQTLSTTGSSTFRAGCSVKNCALDGPLESSNASFLFSCFQQACGIRQKVQ
jgi:hypothetical protein